VKQSWKRAGKSEGLRVEEFLRSREQYCVSACSKFLQTHEMQDQTWRLTNAEGIIRAVILRSGGILFPVFKDARDISFPRFMNGLLGRGCGQSPIHAVQGLPGDTELLVAALAKLGYPAPELRDYDLMALNGPPKRPQPGAGLRGLVLRKPGFADLEAMLPLQAGYEKEEVLPEGADFNPAGCRLNLSNILAREQSLIACLGDRIVGKINTNAASFTRLQIGGVYVLPEYRGLGIGRRMAAAFVGELYKQGRGLSLFVRKNNPAARSIYTGAGFSVLADYRISYY
jgi:ribosomal protein S18 acetylase RimI-like enzyme